MYVPGEEMSIDQANVIDIAHVDKTSGDLWLTIADHMSWEEDEHNHLRLLQDKLNTYLRFVESGEVFETIPNAHGRRIVINVAGKFPLSPNARKFFDQAQAIVEGAGFRLQFEHPRPL